MFAGRLFAPALFRGTGAASVEPQPGCLAISDSAKWNVCVSDRAKFNVAVSDAAKFDCAASDSRCN
jgi:hypothetical protein